MTKREFLKELEDRLQMLDEKERKDMIEEYSQHISMCMKSGMKEEEAIEDFGDMDDLIAEILEAYHLDPEYEVKSRERSGKTGIVDLLPKDFFKKKTKIAKAGNKSNVNDENNKSNPRKNRRVEGTKRFKEEQGRKIENITSKAVKTSSNAVSWSWDKIKKFFFIFIKIVLVFLALPAVFFDLAGLFGLGILGVMAFQGYPVIGCVIIAFGAVLSMTAYILFLFTYCGIGAGVTFQEYSSFKYMGEKRIGSNKIAEKTLTENLYTDKTKKLNTSFIAYNNENENIELKTSKSVPKDKIQIKVRYDADNVKDIHIDKNLYNDDEYIGDDIYIDDDYDENSMDNVALENMTQTDESESAQKNPTSQEFFISAVGRMSDIEYVLSYKDEILKNIKERKIYNYVYPQIISVEITVNPENKNLMKI